MTDASLPAEPNGYTSQVYRCHYEDPTGRRRSVETTKGIWFADAGFWVDKNWQVTLSLDDCIFWIPHHRVVAVEKLHGVRR